MRTVLLLLAAAVVAAATATGFDGHETSGPLGQAGDGRIRIGAQELVLADLDRLVLGDGPAARPAGGFGVLLADGSWLPATSIAAGTGRDSIAVDGPLGRIELPLAAIAGWGDPAPPPAGDGDTVQVASGLLRGRVLGLRDGELAFASAIDPEPLKLKLAEIPAARIAMPAAAAGHGVYLGALIAPAQPPLRLLLGKGGPVLAAAPAVVIDAARLGNLPLRIEGGRRVYLSDLKPVKVREDGAFGVVWPWSADGAIGGGPLLLAGNRYAKGLTVHSAAELAWELDGATHVRLRALAGIADQVAPEGDCLTSLLADGRELWRVRVRGGEAPHPIDLDITGVKQLVLKVELGERQDIGDHLVLADAQLIRR